MNVHTRLSLPSDDPAALRGRAGALTMPPAPFATGGVYVNFMPDDDAERVRGSPTRELRSLRASGPAYDPRNLFRMKPELTPGAVDRMLRPTAASRVFFPVVSGCGR